MRLTFQAFSIANRARCESPDGFGHPLSGWSLSDWFLAAMGEFGEAANVAKKLNRVRDGIPGNDRTEEQLQGDLRNEIADTFIYLDLMAQAAGFSLVDAVQAKFNATSLKIGYKKLLGYVPPVETAPEAGGTTDASPEIGPPVRELLCQRCGHEHLVWHAPNDIWNAVMRPTRTAMDLVEFICPTCFMDLAEAKIGPKIWCLMPGDFPGAQAVYTDTDLERLRGVKDAEADRRVAEAVAAEREALCEWAVCLQNDYAHSHDEGDQYRARTFEEVLDWLDARTRGEEKKA